jgi:Flp pilus assembly CpaF family ATPase
VIVGEVLGDEVVTMLNAMTQGNDGSLSTIHANSSRDVIEKITTYAAQAPERLPREAVTRLVASGLDFVVFIRRVRTDTGQRRLVSSVLEISGINEAGHLLTSEIWQLADNGERIRRTPGVLPACDADLREAGWQDSPDQGGWI